MTNGLIAKKLLSLAVLSAVIFSNASFARPGTKATPTPGPRETGKDTRIDGAGTHTDRAKLGGTVGGVIDALNGKKDDATHQKAVSDMKKILGDLVKVEIKPEEVNKKLAIDPAKFDPKMVTSLNALSGQLDNVLLGKLQSMSPELLGALGIKDAADLKAITDAMNIEEIKGLLKSKSGLDIDELRLMVQDYAVRMAQKAAAASPPQTFDPTSIFKKGGPMAQFLEAYLENRGKIPGNVAPGTFLANALAYAEGPNALRSFAGVLKSGDQDSIKGLNALVTKYGNFLRRALTSPDLMANSATAHDLAWHATNDWMFLELKQDHMEAGSLKKGMTQEEFEHFKCVCTGRCATKIAGKGARSGGGRPAATTSP